LSLNGLVVLDKAGISIYSKIVDITLKKDPLLIGGFLTAMQSFSKHMTGNQHETGIQELQMKNFKIKYRQFKYLTFIGIIDQTSNIKTAEIILEYMIWAFLSKFRLNLQEELIVETTGFEKFDEFFEKFKDSKEKELKKWVENNFTSALQGILNSLENYFPITELLKINPEMITVIGKKLIWVDYKINPEEETKILDFLRQKTAEFYGKELFDNLLKKVQSNLQIAP